MADMQETFRRLQETLTVMEAIQSRQAAVLKEHSQWLQEHDRAHARAMAEFEEQRRRGGEADERIEELGGRIDKLVSAIAELIRTRNGGAQRE